MRKKFDLFIYESQYTHTERTMKKNDNKRAGARDLMRTKKRMIKLQKLIEHLPCHNYQYSKSNVDWYIYFSIDFYPFTKISFHYSNTCLFQINWQIRKKIIDDLLLRLILIFD